MNLQIALHLALASQTPVVLNLLAREVRLLGIEDFSPTLEHLHLALSARCLTATSRRQEDAVLVERGHQAGTLWHVDSAVAIDFDIHIAARR